MPMASEEDIYRQTHIKLCLIDHDGFAASALVKPGDSLKIGCLQRKGTCWYLHLQTDRPGLWHVKLRTQLEEENVIVKSPNVRQKTALASEL